MRHAWAIVVLLVTGAVPSAYDPVCYAKCQSEACRAVCATDEHPEACKRCTDRHDAPCAEQCPAKPMPQPANGLASPRGMARMGR